MTHVGPSGGDLCRRNAVLTIGGAAFSRLCRHVRSEPDREVVGFLLGIDGMAVDAVGVENALNADGAALDAFAVRDEDLRAVRAHAVRRKLSVLAMYHSHPNGRIALSPRDAESLRHSDVPWLIAGIVGGMVACAAYSPPCGVPLAVVAPPPSAACRSEASRTGA